jgi:hypothetical protein
MTDDRGNGGVAPKGSRQDRLKHALRENLKRRKAQSRERDAGEPSETPANLDDAAPDETGGKPDA